MKIGIITVHYNCNYGAVLQAYALQEKLCEMGYDAQIINYINPYGRSEMKIFGKSLKNNIRTLFSLKSKIKRKKNFKRFINEKYRLSGRAIYNYEHLSEDLLKYDIYITGSDQTFNLFLKGDINVRKTYFLPFVKKSRKISYAASMGEKIQNVIPEHKEWMKQALLEYYRVLVREEKTADFIEAELGLNRPKIVIDPTMLLDVEKWDKIRKPTKYEKGKYILFYSVLSAPWVIKYVDDAAKKLNLKVVAPHPKNRYELSSSSLFLRVDDLGPEEFITLIKDAAFVITTSFHGTVFSILNNKPFVSLVLGEGNRIGTLLESLDLSDRQIREDNDKDISVFDDIDYDKVNEKLKALKENSTKLLIEAIGE